MQGFNFGIRATSAGSAGSMDDSRSRYVPSSVYSGPGPVDDSPAVSQHPTYMSGGLRGPFEEATPRFAPVRSPNGTSWYDPRSPGQPPQQPQHYQNNSHPRQSTMLNINDPVAMHLLTETAISDSRDYEVLSFDEIEQLKKEKSFLRAKIETTRRKIALESKVRDAAQSLNRLYSTREHPGLAPEEPKKRRSFLGSNTKPTGADAFLKADDEFAASNKRVEELKHELHHHEHRMIDIERRILEHTAGILQMTHKGLKKNVRRAELPRSPESMTSQTNGRTSVAEGDDFDERSLYQVPDYVNDFGNIPRKGSKGKAVQQQEAMQPLDNFAGRLEELNNRIHTMITQSGPHEHFDRPPLPTDDGMVGRVGAQIQAHLGYMSQGLDAMEAAQARSHAAAQKNVFDSEEQLEDVNLRLHDMLQRTNSVGHSPLLSQDEPRGKDLQSQLAFSSSVLDQLNKRVETLVEQKDILTRQIQQQRELNSKSDAQRDAHIRDLTEQLELQKKLNVTMEEEAQQSREHTTLLMERLDLAQQEGVLRDQQKGVGEDRSMALDAERSVRDEVEKKSLADLEAKQRELEEMDAARQQVTADLQRHKDETEMLRKQMADLEMAKNDAESAAATARGEMTDLEAEVVKAQTELTMVKAELDGAYGSRAQRAADVAMNPAIQREIDGLRNKNQELEQQLEFLTTQHQTKGAGSAELQNKANALQKELKETIEEYEVMTKQAIEDEKERERLEGLADQLQQRCEELEGQLSEEKVKWLGAKSGLPAETTSTMVLKNEFKKMMRETRSESLKAIKAEQEERRRLEAIIKGLRKDTPPPPPQKVAVAPPNGSLEVH